MEKVLIKKIPLSRFATFDVGVIGNKKHTITGLLEIDITIPRQMIRDKIKKGEEISFNSWLYKTIGDVISENPEVQGMYSKKKILTFSSVNISFMLEKKLNTENVPLVAVIKQINKKNIAEVYQEINQYKSVTVKGEKDFVLSTSKNIGQSLYYRLPGFIRVFILERIMKNPQRRMKNMGSVMITNIGASGNISAWILPKTIHNLCFGVGSIVKKPWVVKNKIEVRDILHLTVLFDHDIVDGVPAAEFMKKIVKCIENGRGL